MRSRLDAAIVLLPVAGPALALRGEEGSVRPHRARPRRPRSPTSSPAPRARPETSRRTPSRRRGWPDRERTGPSLPREDAAALCSSLRWAEPAVRPAPTCPLTSRTTADVAARRARVRPPGCRKRVVPRRTSARPSRARCGDTPEVVRPLHPRGSAGSRRHRTRRPSARIPTAIPSGTDAPRGANAPPGWPPEQSPRRLRDGASVIGIDLALRPVPSRGPTPRRRAHGSRGGAGAGPSSAQRSGQPSRGMRVLVLSPEPRPPSSGTLGPRPTKLAFRPATTVVDQRLVRGVAGTATPGSSGHPRSARPRRRGNELAHSFCRYHEEHLGVLRRHHLPWCFWSRIEDVRVCLGTLRTERASSPTPTGEDCLRSAAPRGLLHASLIGLELASRWRADREIDHRHVEPSRPRASRLPPFRRLCP
jgi:hypothetical protein